jgi:hypothetical protein
MARRSDPQRVTSPSSAPHRDERGTAHTILMVHKVGAVLVGSVLLLFAVLGYAAGLPFFSTEGETVLGMSTNGLLSTISVVVGLILIGAAFRSPRTASTVMIVVGILFLLSALLNMALLETDYNLLAFDMSNVIFSVVVGLVLLLLGAYGRISGNLPRESPYAHPVEEDLDEPPMSEELPSTPREREAEEAMREAEIAVAQHTATEEQRRRVEAMSHEHHRRDRRRVWMEFEAHSR